MKDKQIEHIIDSINAGSLVGRAFHHHLMANVHYARVWIEFPNESLPDKDGYDFYFIKHPESDLFVGAVLDMRYDLHAFLKDAYRKQLLMSSALRNVVLPHIFSQQGRFRQYVTYKDTRAKGLMEKVGFTIVDENRAFIDKHQLPNVDFPSPKPSGLSKERIDAIQVRLLKAAGLVRMVRDELAEGLGDCHTHVLSDLAFEVEKKATTAKDYWLDKKYSKPFSTDKII